MILHGVNSDDYLYLKLLEKSDNYPFEYTHLEGGTILRFRIEHLRNWIWKNSIFQNLDCFHFEKKEHPSTTAYLPVALYSRVTVIKDINLQINVDSKDVLLIDEWLWDRLNSKESPTLTPSNQLSFLFGTESSKSPVERNCYHLEHTRLFHYDGKEVVGSSIFETDTPRVSLPQSTLLSLPGTSVGKMNEKNKIIDCYQFGNDSVIVVPLRRGDIIDFTSPVINLLFLRQDYLRMLLNTEEISDREHLEYFQRDFEGYLPSVDRRYFQFPNDLKIHSLKDFTDPKVWGELIKKSSTFQNPFFYYGSDWRFSKTCLDEEGYIRYIWCKDEPIVEHELSKIATRVSYEDALELYKSEQENRKKEEQESHLQQSAKEYFKRNQARYYKLKKRNPNLTYVDFMMQDSYKQRSKKIQSMKRLILVLNHRIDSLK